MPAKMHTGRTGRGNRRTGNRALLSVVFLVSMFSLGGTVTTLAVAPTVTNNQITLATGAKQTIYLSWGAQWTGNVYALTYTILDMPAKGTVTTPYKATYYAVYQSDQSGFVGTDSFTWCASGGSETSNVATCTINIITNSPPVAFDNSFTTLCGVPVRIYMPGNIQHASLDYGQIMNYMIVSQPAHGSAALVSLSHVVYTSAPGFIGTDSFTWAVSDGFDTSAPATFTVKVTANPPAVTNQNAIVLKDTPTTIHPFYTAGGGYTLSLVKVSGPTHGTLGINDAALTFSYKPSPGYIGTDAFKWKIMYSNETTSATNTATVTCSIEVRNANANTDWLQWRFDESRTAQSPAVVPDRLFLQWRRDMRACSGAFGESELADIDNCRPVQMGKSLFAGQLANDSVSAYDTDTGAMKWRYYAGGALRRPPACAALANGTNVVIFGCDDGYVYCLNAEDGSERWKFRAAPNAKKAMGFGRLSSRWPVWASPVVFGGRVYFAAGYLPSYGIFAYCLDAASGSVVWRNDGRMVGSGGISTLGPLTFASDHRRIYSTTACYTPWFLDPATGELMGTLAANISSPYWFIDGKGICQDEPTSITAGGRTFTPENVAPLGVAGNIVSMLAGNGKLFVVTRSGNSGSIYCFGGSQVTPNIYTNEITPLAETADAWTSAVQGMLSRDDLKQGLALVWGVGSGRLVEELAKRATGLMIVAADPDTAKLRALRVKMDAAGLSGTRVSTLQGNPMECGFAPYQAALIASEDVGVAGYSSGPTMVNMLYDCTRPFGGEIWLPTADAQHAAITGWIFGATNLPLCDVSRQNGFTRIARTGLPDDKLVIKPPFAPIAFGSSVAADSLAIPYNSTVPVKGAMAGRDIYSWLPVSASMPGYEPPAPADNNKNMDWALGVRGYSPIALGLLGSSWTNPLFDAVEKSPANVGWSAACPGVKKYGDLYLCLGKTTCLTDMSQYWGVMMFPEIGGCCGPLGCVGNGILLLRSTGMNTCNRTSIKNTQVGLVPAFDEEERLNYCPACSRRTIQDVPVRRIGVNLGAVGDTYLPGEQTLWTHHPYSGRATESAPLVAVTYRGNATNIYHHSAQMETTGPGRRGWVSASQVKGMDGLTVHLASVLVAQKTPIPPVMDGQLSDACWQYPQRVSIAAKQVGCNGGYVMLRYDDNNLYIAGGMNGQVDSKPANNWLKVALNNRDRSTNALIIQATNVWQNGTAAFCAEIAIPLNALEEAGLWKEQLVMNADVCGTYLYGSSPNPLSDCFGPVYLDSARGLASTPKTHTVKLYFAEMEDKPAGGRVFDVSLQGQQALFNLDVAAEAGGPRRELMKEFQNVQIADKLDIDFVRKVGEPMLSGVEIIGTYGEPENTLPTATIDASVLAGTAPLAVEFSAKRSSDPDGQIVECAWETGDGRLAHDTAFRHVFAEPGVYKVNLLVVDDRGGTATTNVSVTVVPYRPAAFVCKIRSSGGDYTNLVAWEAAMRSDLTSPKSLLFAVSNMGNYSPANDDDRPLAFSGGATGILKHVSVAGVAYVASCDGAIAPGTVTCESGHTFSILGTGSQIFTVVAECYNDWPNGLKGNVKTAAGWVTDENHCAVIRAAPGQGHRGKLKDSAGKYTGFTIASGATLDMSKAAYSRVEMIALDGGALTIGAGGSVNRVCGNVCVAGSLATVANSVGATFSTSGSPGDVSFHNCTAQSFKFSPADRLIRYVNCLAAAGGTGFSKGPGLFYRSHCVSADGSASDYYVSEQAGDGNMANQTMIFADAAKKDYHLNLSDTGARGFGTAGLGADIDGDERVGPDYDVGADQTFGNHAPRLTGAPQATPNPVGTGTVVQFSVQACDLDGDPLAYTWAFGDGDGAYGTNVAYAYSSVGTYTARVGVSDGMLTTTGSVVVTVLGTYDAWVVEHFGSTNAVHGGANDDADGDGMSNAQEFLAGTDPLNPDSALALTDIRPEPANGKLVLQWRSESNRWYWIGRSTNLMAAFLPVISNIPATYPLNTCTVDVDAAENGFFVIKLEP